MISISRIEQAIVQDVKKRLCIGDEPAAPGVESLVGGYLWLRRREKRSRRDPGIKVFNRPGRSIFIGLPKSYP